MNGRVYDSTLGRFLSADPYVQAPDDSQSYNRYSYVRNNPLKYTDPSGYSWFSEAWKKYGNAITAIVVTAVVVALTGGIMGTLVINFLGFAGLSGTSALIVGMGIYGGLMGAIGGFVSGAIMSGTWNGALTGAAWGALGGAAAGGIGGYFDSLGGVNAFSREGLRAIAHGLSRGAIANTQGGKFRAGFWSGFAASAFNPGTTMGNASLGRVGGFAVRTTIAATVAGTASELGGGKFANGAVSGAFVHMFNAEGSRIVGAIKKGRLLFVKEEKYYYTSWDEKLARELDIVNFGGREAVQAGLLNLAGTAISVAGVFVSGGIAAWGLWFTGTGLDAYSAIQANDISYISGSVAGIPTNGKVGSLTGAAISIYNNYIRE